MKEAGLFPHTSQSGSALKGRSTEAAAEEAGTDADADAGTAAEDAGADADEDEVGEGGVGEEGTVNDGNVEEVDGTAAALDVFPPFFFVMGWCVGVCGSLRSLMGSSRG